ncbi:MAG: cysteine synthase A [Rhodospirillales bacterium 12-71-4]|nr:MAG: cysteine synthase A [Rhodospirillales bacterium 12-71-4]
MADGPSATRPPRGRLHASVLEAVGGTPLVRHPAGSVKDRIGLAMVQAAEAAGLIAPGRSTLVEPTSGNTGIALAFVAAAKGYRLVVVMPDGASLERRRMMRLMGAALDLTPAKLGMAGAIARAERIAATTPGAWMPRQFDNPANPAIHAATTAEEIWADSAGLVDVVVGGVGTGGTLTGIARALKPRRPGLRVVAVEPAESAVLSGEEAGPHDIQGLGAGFRPKVLELEALDGVRRVSEREALAAARRCAREEGLAIGISSGAVLHAALAIAAEPGMAGRLVVGIAASSAERYLSTRLFEGL